MRNSALVLDVFFVAGLALLVSLWVSERRKVTVTGVGDRT